MQKKLLNINLLIIITSTMLYCTSSKKTDLLLVKQETYRNKDEKFLLEVERKFKNDSLTKNEFLSKKVNYLLYNKKYSEAIDFYNSLDSLDVGYFEYPIERKIMLNNIHILEYSKEGKVKERDSLISYMVKFFIDEQYKLHNRKMKDPGIYSNYLSDKRIQFINMLWTYEDISLNK